MLIDPSSRALRPVAATVLRASTEAGGRPTRGGSPACDRTDVQHELYLEQIEVATPPCQTISDVETGLRRDVAGGRGGTFGRGRCHCGRDARAAPSGGTVTPHRRYQEIVEHYGEVAHESLVCAMHVHVGVGSPEEAVGVIDRIRPWLPVLLALSANSPYWRGVDTGYASWRSSSGRWPTSGPWSSSGTRRRTTPSRSRSSTQVPPWTRACSISMPASRSTTPPWKCGWRTCAPRSRTRCWWRHSSGPGGDGGT